MNPYYEEASSVMVVIFASLFIVSLLHDSIGNNNFFTFALFVSTIGLLVLYAWSSTR
jgi:undecaprenyl pyrophosphate phosphatase UppP